jgi:hypothetical protein
MSRILNEYGFEHASFSGAGEEAMDEVDRLIFLVGRVAAMVNDLRAQYHADRPSHVDG